MKFNDATDPEEPADWPNGGLSAGCVLAICVNWNGRGVLGPTIDSLLTSDYPDLRIVIVDNGSSDDSLREVNEGVTVYRLEENTGYGGAINRVLEPLLQAQKKGKQLPEYLLFINNDLEFDRHAVRHLTEKARQEGPGVYGPKVLSFSKPDCLDAAWGRLTWNHVLTRFYGKGARASDDRWNQERRVELLMGCCLLVHREVVEAIGLFDERFFMYHEEVDFLYRAAKEGFPIWYCPQSIVRHRGAFSTRSRPLQKVFWLRENTVRFLRKYRPGGIRWIYFWATLAGSLFFNLLALRWDRVDVIYRGVREGFES